MPAPSFEGVEKVFHHMDQTHDGTQDSLWSGSRRRLPKCGRTAVSSSKASISTSRSSRKRSG